MNSTITDSNQNTYAVHRDEPALLYRPAGHSPAQRGVVAPVSGPAYFPAWHCPANVTSCRYAQQIGVITCALFRCCSRMTVSSSCTITIASICCAASLPIPPCRACGARQATSTTFIISAYQIILDKRTLLSAMNLDKQGKLDSKQTRNVLERTKASAVETARPWEQV